MRKANSLFFVLFTLIAPSVGFAQILPTDRGTTWNPGIPGGIPTRTTVCATVNASTYGNGASDATGGIQAAINACPLGQVVLLSAGSFKISSGPVFVNKGITLRGAGPTQTTLTAPDGTNQAVVVVGRRWSHPSGSTNLTAKRDERRHFRNGGEYQRPHRWSDGVDRRAYRFVAHALVRRLRYELQGLVFAHGSATDPDDGDCQHQRQRVDVHDAVPHHVRHRAHGTVDRFP